MRSSPWIVVVAVMATVAAIVSVLAACGQIIGADKTRRAAATTDNASDGGLVTTRDAEAEPNKPPPPCPAGQKKCDGTCVDIDDPAFGCGPTSCTQCSLPFAATTKCKAGACAKATCVGGHADCNERDDDGCEADLTDGKTCGSCNVACGPTAMFCTPFGCAADCGDLTPCGSTCVDLTNGSPKHCGQCFRNCPSDPNKNGDATCMNSTCQITCHSGFADCDPSKLGCEALQRYYADTDADGFGAGAFVAACTPPAGYVTAGGDCLDTNKDVHPNQPAYFTAPYAAAAGPSFDYDCSGGEEGNPALIVSATCSPCSPGYTATTPARLPNPRCGSTVFNTCNAEYSSMCFPVATAPYGCR